VVPLFRAFSCEYSPSISKPDSKHVSRGVASSSALSVLTIGSVP